MIASSASKTQSVHGDLCTMELGYVWLKHYRLTTLTAASICTSQGLGFSCKVWSDECRLLFPTIGGHWTLELTWIIFEM